DAEGEVLPVLRGDGGEVEARGGEIDALARRDVAADDHPRPRGVDHLELHEAVGSEDRVAGTHARRERERDDLAGPPAYRMREAELRTRQVLHDRDRR